MWTDFENSFTNWCGENYLCIHTKTAISPAKCCYTTSWKSKSKKNVTDFDGILNKWLTCSWRNFEHVIEHLTVVRQTVSRLLTLSDWGTFLSLSDDVSNQQLNVVASWTHGDFFTMIILALSSFFLCYTSCVVHMFK